MLYTQIINFISASISLYFLILFYFATREELLAYNPVWKFLVVKAILFFTFWQAITLMILVNVGAFDGINLIGTDFDSYEEFGSVFEVCISLYIFNWNNRTLWFALKCLFYHYWWFGRFQWIKLWPICKFGRVNLILYLRWLGIIWKILSVIYQR